MMDLKTVKRIDNGEMAKVMDEQGLEGRRDKNTLIKEKNSWLKENGYDYRSDRGKNVIVLKGTTTIV